MADVNELSFGMLTLGSEGNKQCFVTRMDVKLGVTATLIRACSHVPPGPGSEAKTAPRRPRALELLTVLLLA